MVGSREAILSHEMKAACGEWWEEERFSAPLALQYQPWNHYVLSLCKKEIPFLRNSLFKSLSSHTSILQGPVSERTHLVGQPRIRGKDKHNYVWRKN